MSDTKHVMDLTTVTYRTVVGPDMSVEERVERILQNISGDLRNALLEEIEASVGPDSLTQLKAGARLTVELTIEK